jgi:uncharacterized protein YbjT (DUF2867 family)
LRSVLVTGASGFIGARLVEALLEQGFRVVCAVRDTRIPRRPGLETVQADFTRDFDASVWLPRLRGVDAVVNAVGILREHGSQTFRAVHADAPRALFAACEQAGVKRVVQVSALGADEGAASRYHLSKREADRYLMSLPLSAVIAQPSFVFGPGGASARVFTLWASLPLIPLPGAGEQRVQPIHVDDLVAALLALLDSTHTGPAPLVGPQPLAMRDLLAGLRRSMGLGAPRFVRIPLTAMQAAARVGGLLRSSLLDRETLQMLDRGNTADVALTRELIGRDPRPVSCFMEEHR